MRYLVLFTLLGVLTITAIAQDNNCPTMQRAAFAEAQAWCGDLSDGQACYGNSRATATFSHAVQAFALAGDRVLLTGVESFSTDIDENQHGVVLAQTHSYTNDSWDTQPVALALIGRGTLTNVANEGRIITAITTQIVGTQGANVRTGTSTDYRILETLFEGDSVKVVATLADGSWLRVQLPNGENGWIVRNAVNVDMSSLPPADLSTPDVALLYAPFTAITLETSTLDATCADAPESGLLVQTVDNVSARFIINEISFALQGTAFVQAVDTETAIYVIEGIAEFGDTTVEEGYYYRVTDSLPAPVTIYDYTRFEALPTQLLPRYTYIGLELGLLLAPAPLEDRSPLADMLVTDPCRITTGPSGSNLRGGPGREFPIRGVMAFRESASPTGRTVGSDGGTWWELAQNVWVSGATTVTGGDCISVPQVEQIPVPPPED